MLSGRSCERAPRSIGSSPGMMHFVNAMGGMNREKEGQSMEQQSRNLKNLELFLEKEMDSFSGLEIGQF